MGIMILCFFGSWSGNFTPIYAGRGLLNDNASDPFIDLFGGNSFHDEAVDKAEAAASEDDFYLEETDVADTEGSDDGKGDEGNNSGTSLANVTTVSIIVKWDKIYYKDDTKIDLDELLTQAKQQDKKINIVDDFAESSTYKELVKKLGEYGITDFDETTRE